MNNYSRQKIYDKHTKAPVVSFINKLYPHYLVLVCSRNGFECDFKLELNYIEGVMEDWLRYEISFLVKYRQN